MKRLYRFVKKIFDFAVAQDTQFIYVTVFEQHEPLIKLLETYGFAPYGIKTTPNGDEQVLLKSFVQIKGSPTYDYPIINTRSNKWIISVYDKYHTGLFPDSRLNTESPDLIGDLSFTNSIHKVYISAKQET